jgi:anti-sigma factor RsiW
MSCPSFEALSAEVDGFLSGLEEEATRSHIDGCSHCRARRTELLLLKSVVRDATASASASDALRARLAATVRDRRRSRARRVAALAGALTAAAVAVGLVVPVVRSRAALAELIGDHVDITVKRDEPFDVMGSEPVALARWFEGKIDFPLRIPQLPEARLVGARLCDIGGRRVPLASYEREGRRVSLFASRGASDSQEERCQEGVRGFTVCRRTVGGVDYTLRLSGVGSEVDLHGCAFSQWTAVTAPD